MKNKITKFIYVGLALATSITAHSDIYTLDRNSGQLYKVDADNYSVTPIGTPLTANFLDNLTQHSNGRYPNIDLTHLGEHIYGLVGNARSIDPAMLFRISESGQLDTGFGNAGVKIISLFDGNQFMRSAEGLASNGTNLIIGHSTANETTPFSSIISEYNVNTHSVVSSSAVSSFSGAPSASNLTDMDGLGALNARAMSVDIRNPKSHVIDLGSLPNGGFDDIYNINGGTFGDIAFVTEEKFVVAGDYIVNGSKRNGLHFFSSVNGQQTYLDSAAFPGETGIYAVASTTENEGVNTGDNTVDPNILNPGPPYGSIGSAGPGVVFDPYPKVPNGEHYQCYMLKDGKQIDERITIQDQFGKSSVVIGRPVMICNPSMKVHKREVFGIQDEKRHLVCYNYIKEDRPENHDLYINTQFGKDTVSTTRRELFCAPAGKNHVKR